MHVNNTRSNFTITLPISIWQTKTNTQGLIIFNTIIIERVFCLSLTFSLVQNDYIGYLNLVHSLIQNLNIEHTHIPGFKRFRPGLKLNKPYITNMSRIIIISFWFSPFRRYRRSKRKNSAGPSWSTWIWKKEGCPYDTQDTEKKSHILIFFLLCKSLGGGEWSLSTFPHRVH